MQTKPTHRLTCPPDHAAFASPFADRLFRIAFTLAGFYNLAFGLWAAIWPLSFFQLFDIAPPRYPGIWACLGMVVGVYGLLYWYAAWKLDSAASVIIAVGLLGKILGPIGMVASFSDDWPRRLGMICVFNDLIWWLPFGLFLIRGTRMARRLAGSAPWICLATHVAALAALTLYLQLGTRVAGAPAARAAYVAAQPTLWSLGWATWMASAASLVGFYAWWGGRIASCDQESASSAASVDFQFRAATSAVIVAAVGLVFDFAGEASLILRLVEHASNDLIAFVGVERQFTLLSAGAANALYTLGGAILTLCTPNLPGWIRSSMWSTWLAGGGMTVAAILNSQPGLVISTAVLFPSLLVWIAWMGVTWPAARSAKRGPL